VNGTKIKLTDSFPGISGHAPAVRTRERADTHCTGSWVGPRAGIDGCDILEIKNLHGDTVFIELISDQAINSTLTEPVGASLRLYEPAEPS